MPTPILLAILALLTSAMPGLAQQERLLEPGDSVEVDVFQEPDLHVPKPGNKAVLSKDGKLALPLIGEVGLARLSTAQAAQVIAERYKQGYLRNPKVTVAVTEGAKKFFTVMGAVNKPGGFFLPEGKPLTLLEAIGRAGGYNKVAKPSKVLVKRAGGGKPITLDAKKIANEGEANPFIVQPGDVIDVQESAF
jgi:polysaccharide export outer membrane protein